MPTDEGISGKNIFKRPGVTDMLGGAEQGEFDLVLVWKLSRLARNMRDLLTMCDLLDTHDVRLVSYSEHFDNATATGRLLRNIIGSVAEFERETISENVKLAALERAKNGKPTCPYVLGYDLVDGELDVNPVEATMIKYIYDTYVSTQSFAETARRCQAKGYSGKTGKSIKKAEKIRLILTRPVYVGYNLLHGVLYEGAHEPIIDIDTFKKVQKIIRAKGHGQVKYKQYFVDS